MRFAYPVMLDVTDRLVVIIGGGAVAVRKAAGVLECGARRVRVVAPTIQIDMPPAVERVEAAYDPSQLDGANIVFAATDSPAVNEQVVRDARARGALACRADDADAGDFVTPARFQEGEVVVSVTAGSPALAVEIRNAIAQQIDRGHLMMAHAMQQLRPRIQGAGLTAARRTAIFRELAGAEAIGVVREGGTDALMEWVRQRYPELKL